MLLANLYLNAKQYTGATKYTEAITYSSKVINAGYTLEPKYGDLFLADNNKSKEIIFPVAFDGNKTRTWGGTTYLVHAPIGGDMNANDFGVSDAWGGVRTTKAFVNKFSDITGNTDKRAMFQTAGQNIEINDIGEFRDGYSMRKWKNITSTGAKGSNAIFVDIDFPMFRLAEAYLIYSEAVLRGGTGGSATTALTYFNNVRQRAYNGSTSGNLSAITLDDILDERAREFYWEGKRRTDLIRFDKFTTGSYLWPWKGGVSGGRSVESFRNLYPIPAPELNSNPKLKQNPGY
jgi:starch-binding outer membrane protein, SusD/RagB family